MCSAMKPSHRIMAIVERSADLPAVRDMDGISSLIIRKRSDSIEIDFHTDNPDQAESRLREIAEVKEFRRLNEEPVSYDSEYFQSILASEADIIRRARTMFLEERYWEAHTVLEDLWKASEGPKKKTLQGIIIVAASMTHYQMDELDIAERMYGRALALIREGTGKSPGDYGYGKSFSYPCKFPEVL